MDEIAFDKLLRDCNFIIVPMDIYEKIIPVDEEILKEWVKDYD